MSDGPAAKPNGEAEDAGVVVITCTHCGTDITDRCSIMLAPPGPVLVVPAACPHCRRPTVQMDSGPQLAVPRQRIVVPR